MSLRKSIPLAVLLFLLPTLACATGSTRTTTGASGTATLTAHSASVGATVPASMATGTTAPVAAASPTPKPSPTAAAKVDVVVQNVGTIRTSAALYFVGEIVNKGQVDASDIQVAVSLLDEAGKTIGTGSASSLLPVTPILKVGEKSVWKAMIQSNPASWKEERIQVQAGPVSSIARTLYYLDVKADGVTLNPPANQYGWVSASGQIVNTGQGIATLASVTIAVYDDAGHIIALENGFAKLEQIGPGQSAPFSINFLGLKQLPPKFDVYVVAHTQN